MGPFDLTGGPFLALYAVLFVIAWVASIAIARWLRPEGQMARAADADRLAYLAGGAGRYADAVIARLLARRDVSVEGAKLRITGRAAPGQDVERSVLALASPAGWGRAFAAIAPHARRVDQRLVADGLMMAGGTALQLRFWATTPWLLLFAFGAIKWQIGVMRERPVGFLTAFMVATVMAAVIRFASVDRRTRAALSLLAEERARADRLRRAPTQSELAVGVALFGTGILAGSEWAPYHALRAASGGSGDTGFSSDGGGGGCGGGGGGCGGCGS